MTSPGPVLESKPPTRTSPPGHPGWRPGRGSARRRVVAGGLRTRLCGSSAPVARLRSRSGCAGRQRLQTYGASAPGGGAGDGGGGAEVVTKVVGPDVRPLSDAEYVRDSEYVTEAGALMPAPPRPFPGPQSQGPRSARSPSWERELRATEAGAPLHPYGLERGSAPAFEYPRPPLSPG